MVINYDKAEFHIFRIKAAEARRMKPPGEPGWHWQDPSAAPVGPFADPIAALNSLVRHIRRAARTTAEQRRRAR